MTTRTMSHTHDPETSSEAAEQVSPNTTRGIKLAIIQMLSVKPRTADELTRDYYLDTGYDRPELHDVHNVKRRLSELHQRHHVIRETGDRRPSRLGKASTVWELAVPVEEARLIAGAA